MSRSRLRSGVAIASLSLAPLFAVTPAHATTYDVAGLRLDFGNAVDQYILQSAEVNDSYLYENIATVDGVQIDAVVTVTAMSENSLGDYPHEAITEAQIEVLNADNSEHVDVAGCYSTPEYVSAYEASEAYDFLGFNEPGALKGGLEVEYIDGYENDPEWEYTISTGLDLCDPGYTGDVDGFVDINVAFEVNGEPVTLNNVVINATDIDNEQIVTFWSPKPDTFVTSGADSMVEIVETPDYVSFVGPAEGDIEGQEDRFVGEVSYDGISELDYTFELVNGSSGSLQLAFESYFSGEGSLASTGVEAGPSGVAGIAALGLGAAAVVARRVRRNRA